MKKEPYKLIDDGDYGVPDKENPELPADFFQKVRPLSELLNELAAKSNTKKTVYRLNLCG